MATLDNDMIRVRTDLFGIRDFRLKSLGLEWPPPEYLYIDSVEGLREAREGDDGNFILERVSMSQLTDQHADHPNLARGATYVYIVDINTEQS